MFAFNLERPFITTFIFHQVKQGSVRQQQPDGSLVHGYSLEVTGPLLPTNLTQLHWLLHSTNTTYTATYSIHEPTTPFSGLLGSQFDGQGGEDSVRDSWQGCGVESGMFRGALEGVCLSKEVNNGRQAIRELTCEDGHFSWLS